MAATFPAVLFVAGAATLQIASPLSLRIADCGDPAHETEVRCSAKLSALDAMMSSKLSDALEANAPAADSMIEKQDAWLRRRNLCPSKACVEAAYQERIAVLEAIASSPDRTDRLPYICARAPWGDADIRVTWSKSGIAVVRTARGRVVAVASALRKAGWSPFVRIRVSGDTLHFMTISAQGTKCSPRDTI